MDEKLKQYAKDYKMIPISKEIYADIITPITLLRRISQSSSRYFLLESIENGEKWSRYSFLGYDPKMRISCKDHVVKIENGDTKEIKSENPMDVLRQVLSEYKAPKIEGMPPLTGGLVGYFGYNMVSLAEPVLKLLQGSEQDFDLMLFDKIIAYDHLKQKITVIANVKTDDLENDYQRAQADLDSMISMIKQPMEIKEEQMDSKVNFVCNKTEEEFSKMLEKAKKYIVDGDIFQAVLSRKFTTEYKNSLINPYRVLRTTNPSPYMVYLKSEDVELICSSPETLVKLQDGRLSTFPVAGSRPRGENAAEDERLIKDLLQDEKELAEHNMLVDLGRNDLGKIAKYGTVEVVKYKAIHKYSKIIHMTSIVEGDIKEDKDACDAIEAILPAGTLSGAPKIRACEIIDELEGEPRGVYGGAIGYLDFTGNMDTCIAIRMAVKQKETVTVQAGGGIVYDSVAKTEYIESANKAGAVIHAIESAGEVERL